MHKVLISEITRCQSHKNIIEERRNTFQWRFSWAHWGFPQGRPSEPPENGFLGLLLKWAGFCSANTHSTQRIVSPGLLVGSSLCFKEAPLWLQLKGSVLCPHAGVTRGISASWLSGQSSGLWEAALQPDPGGGTLTPQCLHCGPFSPPASGTTGRTKVKLLPCCLATPGKEAQRGRAEWKKTRFLFSFT